MQLTISFSKDIYLKYFNRTNHFSTILVDNIHGVPVLMVQMWRYIRK